MREPNGSQRGRGREKEREREREREEEQPVVRHSATHTRFTLRFTEMLQKHSSNNDSYPRLAPAVTSSHTLSKNISPPPPTSLHVFCLTHCCTHVHTDTVCTCHDARRDKRSAYRAIFPHAPPYRALPIGTPQAVLTPSLSFLRPIILDQGWDSGTVSHRVSQTAGEFARLDQLALGCLREVIDNPDIKTIQPT